MRRPPVLTIAAVMAGLLAAAVPAPVAAQTVKQQPAGAQTVKQQPAAPARPPLSLENAVPLSVPAAPRLKTPTAPSAPQPLRAPEIMAFPGPVDMTPGAPVAAPVNPIGAPPPPPRVPTAPRTQEPPPPGVASPAPEQRITGAPIPSPSLAPSPSAAAAQAAAVGSIAFPAGLSVLPVTAQPLLGQIADQMQARPGRRLQLRGYAAGAVDSDRQARQLSLARVQNVREFLVALGVRSTRIDLRPLGAALPPGDRSGPDRVDLEFTSD